MSLLHLSIHENEGQTQRKDASVTMLSIQRKITETLSHPASLSANQVLLPAHPCKASLRATDVAYFLWTISRENNILWNIEEGNYQKKIFFLTTLHKLAAYNREVDRMGLS